MKNLKSTYESCKLRPVFSEMVLVPSLCFKLSHVSHYSSYMVASSYVCPTIYVTGILSVS